MKQDLILNIIFQIESVEFELKMSALIYLHHNGQFLLKGTDTKVTAIRGKKLYLETVHDLTYSYYPKFREVKNETELICNPAMNLKYDICVLDVSKSCLC